MCACSFSVYSLVRSEAARWCAGVSGSPRECTALYTVGERESNTSTPEQGAFTDPDVMRSGDKWPTR